MITWSSQSRRQLPAQRSATPFCHGLRKVVRVGWLPISLTAETTSSPNFASRSNSKILWVFLKPHASRICCATQRALGFRVTLKRRILPRSWPMTKKQNTKRERWDGEEVHGGYRFPMVSKKD